MIACADGIYIDSYSWPYEIKYWLFCTLFLQRVISAQFDMTLLDLTGCLDSGLL